MGKTVGALIKKARTDAGYTQEKLADALGKDVSASDISKAERGEDELTQAQLKKIAVLCNVTQASLLSAARQESQKGTTAKAVKKSTAGSKSKAGKAKTTAPKVPAAATISIKVTNTEKKLIELYRAADSATRKNALSVLKGEETGMIETLITKAASSDAIGNLIADLIGGK